MFVKRAWQKKQRGRTSFITFSCKGERNMKRVSYLSVYVLLSFMWIPLVSAGPNNSSPTQEQQGQVQTSAQSNHAIQSRVGLPGKEKVTTQRVITVPRDPIIPPSDPIIPPRAGISWKEKVMMEREIQKRAAASRNALMREAAMGSQQESQNATQTSPVIP